MVLRGEAGERALDVDRVAGLEDQRIPVLRVLQIGDGAVADDGLVLQLQIGRLEPRALAGVGIGLRRVRDREHDHVAVLRALECLVRGVAVALRPAGRLVPLLDLQARGHVRGLGPHHVRLQFTAVVAFGEHILVAVGDHDALDLDVGAPALFVRGVRGHQAAVQFGGLDGHLAGGRIQLGGEHVAAQLRAVEAAAGDHRALGGDDLAVTVQVAARVHGPLARQHVDRRIQLVVDAPLRDLGVGAIGRQDARIQLVEERAIQVDALAVRRIAADLDRDVFRRVDRLQRVADRVGLLADVVDDLGRRVLDHVPVVDLDDLVRHDHLVGVAEQRLIDRRIRERIVILVGQLAVGLEVGGLGVAGHGLARGRDLRVHGLRERVEHAVLDRDVELRGDVGAVLVEDLDVGGEDLQVLVVVVVDDAGAPDLVRGVLLGQIKRDDVVAGVAQQQGLPVDRHGRIALLGGLVVLL